MIQSLALESLSAYFSEAVRPRVTTANVSKLYKKYIKVQSSNIHSIWYDKVPQRMRVRFNSGAEYEYERVPERIYIQLLNAPSHGKAFWKLARNVFRYRRLPNWDELT